jgi:hypothetical protein
MMKIKYTFFLLAAIICCSCHHVQQSGNDSSQSDNEATDVEQQMENEGWTPVSHENGELGKEFGIDNKYGLQDNYFDITIGKGFNVAIKIMDFETNKCIRYIYVSEASTAAVNDIPQGKYYLKLAYGNNWMELQTDSITIGKFTNDILYERSKDVYDFGKKNSTSIVNYQLKINVTDNGTMNNFETVAISEKEFMK